MKENETDRLVTRNMVVPDGAWGEPAFMSRGRTDAEVREGLVKDLIHCKNRDESMTPEQIIEAVDILFNYIKTGEK